MKRFHLAICAIALLFPIALKLSTPLLSRLAAEAEELTSLRSHPKTSYLVASIHGTTLTLQTPDGAHIHVQLAGIKPLEAQVAEASGVTAMLIQTANGRVNLAHVQKINPELERAIVQLPNSTSLQHVLLADGLATLDKSQLKDLPQSVAIDLRQAQAIAQAQRKIFSSSCPTVQTQS